ncbi:MAG: hypothetical protein AMXMBFR7_11080 [Planctomycetota bacterium]
MTLDDVLLDAEDRMIKTNADYEHFLKGVRTGEASVEILDGVQADIPSFGGLVPLKSVAVVSKQGATMLAIKPFDPKTIKEIERAIMHHPFERRQSDPPRVSFDEPGTARADGEDD